MTRQRMYNLWLRADHWLRRRPAAATAVSAALLAVLGYVDYITGDDVRIFTLYFLPIILVSVYGRGRVAVGIVTLLAGAIWTLDTVLTGTYSSHWIHAWNGSVLLAAFAIVAWMVLGIRRQMEARQRLNRQLQAVLEETRRLSLELNRSNEDLAQFAYVASHDLQEPLRMVVGYMDLLERRCREQLDESARQFIALGADGARRMQRMIRDLLDYSRLDAVNRSPKPVSMQAVYERVVADLSGRIAQAGAVVTRDELPTVAGDKTQMTQLLQNLIGNAIKFRRQDVPPRVHIGAERQDEHWLFRVADNGIGLDPRHAERIFQVFQRLHTPDAYEGTGIGLAVCKRIVERHGGRIWAEGRPGQGTTFLFTLNAHDPHARNESAPAEGTPAAPPSR